MKKNITIGILLITTIWGFTTAHINRTQLDETQKAAIAVMRDNQEKISTLSGLYDDLYEKYTVATKTLEKVQAENGSLEVQFAYLDSKYGDLDKVLTQVADQEYILNEHDCKHFSAELHNELKEIGIESGIVVGRDGQKKGHAWVGLWIEPQRGDFVAVADDYDEVFPDKNSTVEVIDVYFTSDEVYSVPHVNQ